MSVRFANVKIASHSRSDPKAIWKKRSWSLKLLRPRPSAKFKAILEAARSSWLWSAPGSFWHWICAYPLVLKSDSAVCYQRSAFRTQLHAELCNQFVRAASSIALNLAEGAGRNGRKDQRRFFHIAMGSLRECQAVLDLAFSTEHPARQTADVLGAHLFKLIKSYE